MDIQRSICLFCAVLYFVTQSLPTLFKLMDCSSLGFSVHGDSPGKNTGVDCHAHLQGSSQPRDQTQVSCTAGGFFFFFHWRLITLQYCSGFCHTFTWISHGCTCFPHPEPPSHFSPQTIPQDHPSAPALSTLSHASNLDWWFVPHMVIYLFQCYSLKSSHPHLFPQSPKVCSLSLCLFCCLTYRVITIIFLNSIYMH